MRREYPFLVVAVLRSISVGKIMHPHGVLFSPPSIAGVILALPEKRLVAVLATLHSPSTLPSDTSGLVCAAAVHFQVYWRLFCS